MKFDELGLCNELLKGIEKLGFETPTPIQAEVIPYLLKNDEDIVAMAQTGTGKTAAFGLPIIELLNLEVNLPQALILCPTRELCIQIARDLRKFSSSLPEVKILSVYGGTSIKPQLTALEKGVHIIVATPGRMHDLLRRKRANFSTINKLVLDEADEMLNMGFEEDLDAILSKVPDNAQTLLFAATMPKGVAKIAKKYMHKPHEITMGIKNAGADNVEHEYFVVHSKDRYRALRRIVDINPRMYGIVFCRTRQETQQIADFLSKDGYNAESLHGELSQQQRDQVMKKFREHHVQLLVATDVASRGLDVNDLTHVINYNLPDDLSVYTHRSGRTGRAGKGGTSITIIHMREHFKIKRVEQEIGKKFTKKLVPTGEEISHTRLINLAERVKNLTPNNEFIDSNMDEINELMADISKEEIFKRFASIELHRLLNFYRDAPDLNVEPVNGRYNDSGKHNQRNKPNHSYEDKVELVMNVGKVNGLTPKKLMSLINVADRGSSIDVGRIKIINKQAFFGVSRSDVQGVIKSFENNSIIHDDRLVNVSIPGDKNDRKPQSRRKNRKVSITGERKGYNPKTSRKNKGSNKRRRNK